MASLKKSIIKLVLNRDNNRCQKCGRDHALHIHHIVATIDGGSDEQENLITLCVACHKEWEAVEYTSNIEFWDWLKYPCIGRLLAGLFKTTIPKHISATVLISSLLEADMMYRNPSYWSN